jgi:hypothetical protein
MDTIRNNFLEGKRPLAYTPKKIKLQAIYVCDDKKMNFIELMRV